MPPKKAWRSIQNLSGGEKTLSSLSLIFALHQYKKNFIYVVDEIDAALDFRNVSLVANYLKEQAKDCQFVIISLRNNTFEVADELVGVYKKNNLSNVVTLDLTKWNFQKITLFYSSYCVLRRFLFRQGTQNMHLMTSPSSITASNKHTHRIAICKADIFPLGSSCAICSIAIPWGQK